MQLFTIIILYVDLQVITAQSQYNPSGRIAASHVSVGLLEQQSPREMNEKWKKQMEHRVHCE